MSPYQVELTRTAKRQLDGLHGETKDRVNEALEQLSTQPRGANVKKLKIAKRSLYRKRVGDFRIVYGIDDPNRKVVVKDIDNRKDVYRP